MYALKMTKELIGSERLALLEAFIDALSHTRSSEEAFVNVGLPYDKLKRRLDEDATSVMLGEIEVAEQRDHHQSMLIRAARLMSLRLNVAAICHTRQPTTGSTLIALELLFDIRDRDRGFDEPCDGRLLAARVLADFSLAISVAGDLGASPDLARFYSTFDDHRRFSHGH